MFNNLSNSRHTKVITKLVSVQSCYATIFRIQIQCGRKRIQCPARRPMIHYIYTFVTNGILILLGTPVAKSTWAPQPCSSVLTSMCREAAASDSVKAHLISSVALPLVLPHKLSARINPNLENQAMTLYTNKVSEIYLPV